VEAFLIGFLGRRGSREREGRGREAKESGPKGGNQTRKENKGPFLRKLKRFPNFLIQRPRIFSNFLI
jgi:hypothetical protein